MAPEMVTDQTNLPAWGDPAWEAMDSDKFADTIAKKMEEEESALTPDQMDLIEEKWEDSRRNRRCILAMLTKPYAEIREMVEGDREFAKCVASAYSVLDDQIGFTNTLLALFKDAQRRMMVALAHREDMSAVIDEAKSELEQPS